MEKAPPSPAKGSAVGCGGVGDNEVV